MFYIDIFIDRSAENAALTNCYNFTQEKDFSAYRLRSTEDIYYLIITVQYTIYKQQKKKSKCYSY